MLIELVDFLLFSKSLEQQKEHDVMREHDDLSSLGLMHEALSYAFAPSVVERRDRIPTLPT
ncbi:MAG: hypothetical protein AAF493_17345 [Pseudomonadota bacterium]